MPRPRTTRLDVDGRAVLPGFVDSHAHLVFAGERTAEFAARMAGPPYKAGGIATTSRRPGPPPTSDSARTCALACGDARAGHDYRGIKSGYGLTVADERSRSRSRPS